MVTQQAENSVEEADGVGSSRMLCSARVHPASGTRVPRGEMGSSAGVLLVKSCRTGDLVVTHHLLGLSIFSVTCCFYGGPSGIRTPDPLIKSLFLNVPTALPLVDELS